MAPISEPPPDCCMVTFAAFAGNAPALRRTVTVVRIRLLLSGAQPAAQGSERPKAFQVLNAALAEAKPLGYGDFERQAPGTVA